MVETGKAAAPQWTQARRAAFLEKLALTSNVAASERAAKMPAGSAYRERRKHPAFREAWADALCEGYDRLELVMLERAIRGTVKTVTKKGETVTTTEYSDRQGMALLTAHRAAVSAVRGGATEAESAKERLARKIGEIRQRMAGDDGGNGGEAAA